MAAQFIDIPLLIGLSDETVSSCKMMTLLSKSRVHAVRIGCASVNQSHIIMYMAIVTIIQYTVTNIIEDSFCIHS